MTERPRRTPDPGPKSPDGAPAIEPLAWVDEHGDALYRYARLHCRDRETAEDLVQETFFAALRARQRFRGRSTERTWLIGILRHKIHDLYRRRRREVPLAELGPDPLADAFDEQGYWKSPPAPRPGQALEEDELRERVRGCVARLPPGLHEAFCLRVFGELAGEAICDILGISPTNLSTRLTRARELLRRCLEDREPLTPGSQHVR